MRGATIPSLQRPRFWISQPSPMISFIKHILCLRKNDLHVDTNEKMMDYSSKEFEEMPDEMKYIFEEENEGLAPEEKVLADKIIDEMIREDVNVNSLNGSPPMTSHMHELPTVF
uniref:Uncharacterized protein n=1 Tax=Tanacetum cinerariifolium TaxID=118510 RepID=A0A699JMN2_TANCI|nr:hypothetical protein [Tanacetum cinerariifolium]